MKGYLLFIFFATFSISLNAQSDTDILLTVNDEAITVDEFKRVYLKNIDLVTEAQKKKGPEAYLDLFIPYKLKVQEAYALGLHEKSSYKNELDGYKRQLSKTFLTDVSITDELVKEAYERSINEVNARHILIKVAPNALPADTLKAYNKIMEAREKVLQGGDFKAIATAYSDDPSAKINGGELGWFKAFKMVYPFENAAFTTPVGEVSHPFKTRFGYHIVQTTATRKTEGAVQVAHIMIAHKQQDSSVNAQERIIKMDELLKEGEDFASLAKTYSDDKQSASKGGELRAFEKGQLRSPEFEEVAFKLDNPGDLSEPFKTKFGWHIIKLLKKIPVKTFEEEKPALENRVKKDNRAQVISDVLTEKLRKEYKQENIAQIIKLVKDTKTGTFENDKWVFNTDSALAQKAIFTLKDSTYILKDLGAYLERTYTPKQFGTPDQFFNETVRKYVDTKVRLYHQDHLEEVDDEFASLLKEYKEGLLIFDLMEQKIWSKAKSDTVGLEQFYRKNKDNYIIPETVVATVYTSQNKKSLDAIMNILKKGEEVSLIAGLKDVIKTSKNIEIEDTSVPPSFSRTLGLSEVYTFNNGYALYNITEIKPRRLKTLEEARGAVISDYQKELENKWIASLQSNAVINVRKKVLKKLKKQFD